MWFDLGKQMSSRAGQRMDFSALLSDFDICSFATCAEQKYCGAYARDNIDGCTL